MDKFTWYLPQTMDEVIKKRFGFHSDLDEDSHGFQVSLVMLATVHTDRHQQILGGPGKLLNCHQYIIIRMLGLVYSKIL